LHEQATLLVSHDIMKRKGDTMINKNTQTNNRKSRGVVSLFVVVFTALLFVTVTVGFTILMLSNQQRATDNDLAQSALDSAQAGTEDAKRVLAKLADCQEKGLLGSDLTCQTINDAVNASDCNTVGRAMGDVSANPERLVQQSPDDKALEQAYTCIKIRPDTDSYIGKTKDEGEVRVIPLKADASFDKVRVSWLQRDDMSLAAGEIPNFSVPRHDDNTIRLPGKDQWIAGLDAADHALGKRGALLRVQSIQYKPGDVNINNIDNDQRTAFLYPSEVGTNTVDLKTADTHKAIFEDNRDAPIDGIYNKPQLVQCDKNRTSGYLCYADVRLVHGQDHFTYLTLASVYRATSFQVELMKDDDTIVKFKNVQPEIDATGRANDVFRRIVSRVESADANQAPYPRAEVGTGENMCKNYVITDDPDDFRDYTGAMCPDIVNITPTK
jgi:hypothetical protein